MLMFKTFQSFKKSIERFHLNELMCSYILDSIKKLFIDEID